MAVVIRELVEQPENLASGHGLCAGCAESIIVRQVMHALNKQTVVAISTGCLEVSTTRFPWTAWKVPAFHSAFENSATTISGIEAAYKALVRKGRMEKQDIAFVAFGGDGATYDIGFQWLSGALERGHKFIYICLNNEGYMNTGIQRSSATIEGTWTTTTPVGEVLPGKPQWRKDLTSIVADHNVPFVAQAALHNWKDLMGKVQRAAEVDGPAFINMLSPCTRGWRYEPDQTVRISKIAADTCIWPLYEVDHGVWKLDYKPKEKLPIEEWLKSQGRFAHLLKGEQSKAIVAEIQKQVDREWDKLVYRCAQPVPATAQPPAPHAQAAD